MKTGRKPNGEDPKKPKAQGEVKVTAKKPVEPPQKQYTWDDVSRNIDIQERNKAKKAQYESDVASYNKAMKLYKEGPEASNVSSNIPTGKLKGGKTVSFTGGDYLSAEKSNKMLQEQLKRGELVSIDDPSLDHTTKKLLRGVMGDLGEGSTDIVGSVSKTYVPKGTKYSSYKEIYGEDFNPEEYRAASKSGKFEEYAKSKGYGGRAFAPKVSFYQKYKEPEQAKAPTYEKEENIDIKKIPIPKMRQLKSDETIEKGVIKKKTYGKLAEYKAPAPAEKPDWEAPEGSIKTRSRYVKPKNVKAGEYVKENIKYGLKKMAGDKPVLRPGVLKTREALIQGKSGREAKMAKAYFSGYEGKSKFDIEGTSEERGAIGKLKADKADLKAGIKEARKAGDREKVQGYRAAKKDVKGEIKQAKLASKYVSKLGQEYTGVREGQELRSTGKIKANTPAAYLGFTGSKQDTYNSDANFNKFLAKRSTDNPANRNTIAAQEKSLSFKERTAQRKTDRAQRKADTKLQQSIKIPN